MAERKSNLCHLCSNRDNNLSLLSKWSEELKSFVLLHLQDGSSSRSEVNTGIFVCKKHLLEARRHHTDPGYTPKWKKKEKSNKLLITCMYLNCTNTNEKTNIIKATFVSKDQLIEAMGLQQTSDRADVTVCENHYSKLYMEINPMKCASCNGWPKKGMIFTHHSPNCELVSQYLNDSTCISITSNDLLCQSCYKNHYSILKFLDSQPNNLDNKLLEDIEMWKTILNTSSSISKPTRAV